MTKASSTDYVEPTLNNLNSEKAFDKERQILMSLIKTKLRKKLKFIRHKAVFIDENTNTSTSVASSMFNESIQHSLTANTSVTSSTI